jgi:hypothetical protein|tara:strand:+ start:172 stop:546 length:375 start_codon:yes stop_codon:yes gene_type:complete
MTDDKQNNGVFICKECDVESGKSSKKYDEAKCPTCGGNTTERIEEQTDRLNAIAAAKRVIEEHKDALQKLADNPVYDEDFLDDEEDALLNKMCDEIEAECFAKDFDYDRVKMKKRLQKILDSYK